MAFKVLTLISLFVAITYILTEGNLYLIHSVNDIKNGKIIKHSKGFTRTTCLLKCRNNQDCDTVYFKADQGNNAIGECWFVQEGGEDELELPNKSDGGKVESFENVPSCGIKKKNTSSNGLDLNFQFTVSNEKFKASIATIYYTTDGWELQATNVCFGAKDDTYGNFTIKHTGTITKLKLEHTGEEATLNCGPTPNPGSRWGCNHDDKHDMIFTAITDKENTIIIPNSNPSYHYTLLGYHHNSPYLQFIDLNIPGKYGDELRIWYLEDLRDYTEHNNGGRSCAHVYVMFSE